MEHKNDQIKELRYQLIGWTLFLICAVLFTLAGISAGDALTIAASVIFLLACLVFMIPLIKAVRDT